MMYMKELQKQVKPYVDHLNREEKNPSTVAQYRRNIRELLEWGRDKELTKETLIDYKKGLMESCKAASVNTKLAAINSFLKFSGNGEMKVRQLSIQKQAYSPKERELGKKEYRCLIRAARGKNNERLALLLQTLCGTGIRVGELAFITVEAVRNGEAAICMKGKNRRILLPGRLCRVLERYAEKLGITAGPIFITRTGKPIDRSNVWKMMRSLCKEAGVEPQKVFPHNLRHLFARCFYAVDKDLAKLADILGHSSINTTRIYIISSGTEHRRCMDALGLVG